MTPAPTRTALAAVSLAVPLALVVPAAAMAAPPASASGDNFSGVHVTTAPGAWCAKNNDGSNDNRLELKCHQVPYSFFGDSVSVIMPNTQYQTTVTNGSSTSGVTVIRGNWMHAEVDRAHLPKYGDSVTDRGNGIEYANNAGWTVGVNSSRYGDVPNDVTIDIDYAPAAAQ